MHDPASEPLVVEGCEGLLHGGSDHRPRWRIRRTLTGALETANDTICIVGDGALSTLAA